MTQLKLLIADDHALMREGIKQLIALNKDVVVAAVAENGGQVMDVLRGRDSFDLVLLDMTMPGVSGVDLIAWIRAFSPSLPILVLSMHNEPKIIMRALQAGASGYLCKDSDPQDLMTAIRKVSRGGQFIDPLLVEQMAFNESPFSQKSPHKKLTERELHILRLLVRGVSITKISEMLSISDKTVSSHKARLMRKMDIPSNAELVRYAVAHGLVE